MAEGLYNGRGAEDIEETTLWQWMALLDGSLRYLGRHYGTATVQVPLPLWHLQGSLTGIYNVTDGSLLLSPRVHYDWSQNLAFDLYGALSWSDAEEGELASGGSGVYLRGRFSF